MTERRKTVFFILLILLLAGLAAIYHKAVLVSLGKYLITEHRLEKADAICVLAGSIPDRILEAVDIYRQGYAPLIILTREEEPSGLDKLLKLGIRVPEGYELNKRIALKLGVPVSSIVIVNERANSTYAEALAVSDLLKKKNIKSIIIVTSKSHTTRATKLFNLVVGGEGVKIITRPSKYDTFDPENWWKERRDLKQIIWEYQKLLYYYYLLIASLV
jgi:uncharacterized SAM-binding protein YcdF (DUF218 family)